MLTPENQEILAGILKDTQRFQDVQKDMSEYYSPNNVSCYVSFVTSNIFSADLFEEPNDQKFEQAVELLTQIAIQKLYLFAEVDHLPHERQLAQFIRCANQYCRTTLVGMIPTSRLAYINRAFNELALSDVKQCLQNKVRS